MNSNDDIMGRIESTVHSLKGKLESQWEHIRAHETRTRVILIDPLLRSRGWDPEDPRLVHHEYRVNQGWADYALMDGDSVVAIIEAKKLGQKFADGALVEKVAAFPGIKLVIFTNGNEWQFFRAPKFASKRIKVDSTNEFKTAFEFHSQLPDPKLNGPIKVDPPEPKQRVPLPDADPDRSPSQVYFESGSQLSVTSWGKVYVEVTRHVIDNGLVGSDDYPVVLARGKHPKTCALNTSPVYQSGKDFWSPVKVREGIWLETGLGSDKRRWQHSIRMLEKFGVDPMTVYVECAEPPAKSTKSPRRP